MANYELLVKFPDPDIVYCLLSQSLFIHNIEAHCSYTNWTNWFLFMITLVPLLQIRQQKNLTKKVEKHDIGLDASGGDFFWMVGGRGAEPPAHRQSPWSGGQRCSGNFFIYGNAYMASRPSPSHPPFPCSHSLPSLFPFLPFPPPQK